MPGKDTILKRLEIRFRKVLNKRLNGNHDTVRITEPSDIFHLGKGSKILMLRQDRIGDVLITIPMLRLLKKKLPETHIDILLSKRNIGAKRALFKYVDNILVYDKKIGSTINLIRKIRKEDYDLIIDLFDNVSTTSAFFVQFSGAKYSLGLERSNYETFTHVVPLPDKNKVHIVERVAQLLLPFGIEPKPEELKMEYTADTNKGFELTGRKEKKIRLGVNLSGSSEAKYWGTENNIKLINEILKNPQVEIFVFGTEHYRRDIDIITGKTGAKAAPVTKSFNEFACMLSTCDIIITPDTSAVHLAAAWKKPCIVLYATIENNPGGMPWLPYNSKHKALITYNEDIKNIHVKEVLDAVNDYIKELIKE